MLNKFNQALNLFSGHILGLIQLNLFMNIYLIFILFGILLIVLLKGIFIIVKNEIKIRSFSKMIKEKLKEQNRIKLAYIKSELKNSLTPLIPPGTLQPKVVLGKELPPQTKFFSPF